MAALPHPVLIPKLMWHTEGHSIIESTYGYVPSEMERVNKLIDNLPNPNLRLLSMVVLVIKNACENERVFVIENDLDRISNILGYALC